MGKIDLTKVPCEAGSAYPHPFHQPADGRVRQALGDAGGLKQFGINRTVLPPGAISSQRHWHTEEDEAVYVLSGEVTLITDAGESVLKAGDFAAYPAGEANGHHMANQSSEPAVYLEIGSRITTDDVHYPDVDLFWDHARGWYTHKDGAPYPSPK